MNTYQHTSLSIAEMCINRASINRELMTAPGICIRENRSQNRPRVTYRDEFGEVTTRAVIAKKYGFDLKTITNCFNKYNSDFVAVHKDLGARL